MINTQGLLPVTMLYALCSILLAVSMPAALGQHRVGARPPHEKWTNSLKPRGVPGPEITLASAGKSFYTILLPADPTGQDKKAAEDLAKYLKQMTDADFPIVHEREAGTRPEKVISIGRTEALRRAGIPEASVNLSKDGYAIAVKNDDLFLLGGSRRGPINAVYALLEEDLGCRWYDSSEANAVIPHLPQLTFQPVPRAYVPQFEEMRWILVWEAKNVNFSLWNRSMDCDMYRRFPVEWGGIDTVSGIHNLTDIVSPDKYFEKHPEYFAIIDGKRDPVQLCMSNPDVVKILTQYALDYEGRHVVLGPRDGPEYCQCPKCQALIDREGTPAAPLLNVANQVAEVVGEQQPDKRIWILAYQSTAKPPKTMRPRDNVIVWLCSNSHGFGPATLYLTQTPTFQSYLEGWESLGAKIAVWEYVTNFGTDMHLCPLPNLHVVGQDLRYLAGHKSVVGILLEGCLWGRGDRGRMRAWVWAKQTWNPSLDTQDLIRDFVYGYYGKAAEPIYRYNELLRYTWDRWHKSMVSLDKKRGATPPLTEEFITQASELFDEAEKLASDDEVLASRVEDARIPVLFQQLLSGLSRAEDTRNPLPADDPYWGIVERLRDYCNRWQTGLIGRYDALARAEAARQGDTADKSILQTLDTKYGRIYVQTLPPRWSFATDPEKVGMSQEWYAPDYDDTDWSTIRTDLDAGWQAQGFSGADSDAFGWYRQNTYVYNNTSPWRPSNWYMYFEAVDEDAYVYINGKKAFEHSCDSTGLKPEVIWETPFMFKANGFINPGANNLFAVGVYNRKMMGGIWKPVHIVACEAELDLQALREVLKK